MVLVSAKSCCNLPPIGFDLEGFYLVRRRFCLHTFVCPSIWLAETGQTASYCHLRCALSIRVLTVNRLQMIQYYLVLAEVRLGETKLTSWSCIFYRVISPCLEDLFMAVVPLERSNDAMALHSDPSIIHRVPYSSTWGHDEGTRAPKDFPLPANRPYSAPYFPTQEEGFR